MAHQPSHEAPTNLFLSLEDVTVLEVDRPSERETVLKEVDTSFHNNEATFDLPEGSFVILTETELFNRDKECKEDSALDDAADDKGGGRWLLKHELTVEIDGADKPALIGEWLGMQMVDPKIEP